MSAQTPLAPADVLHEIRFCSRTSASRWEVAIHTTICAEPALLFHAITLPEYREAWICPPEQEAAYSVLATLDHPHYGLYLSQSGARDLSISGAYAVANPQEMVFTWKKDAPAAGPETVVQIRLRNQAGRCNLRLSHRGFTSKAEGLWHQRFWSISLGKLARLVERSPL